MSDQQATTSRTGDDAPGPDPRRWRILGVTLVIGFMALLDVTIVNVAIPSMRVGLHTSTSTVQWVVSGYALTFGLTLVTGGRLGDAYGRRRMMLIGLVGFVVTSAAVGLAPGAAWVIAARLLQGAAAGLLTPQNTGLIQQLFRGPERGRAFGLFGLTVSISSGLGPVIGGLIISTAGEANGWRYLFLVNVPIGLVAMVFVARLVPGRSHEEGEQEGAPATGRTQLDLAGALLLGGGVLCLLFPLVSIESGARWPLVLLIGAPLFLWGFVRWERRVRRRGQPPLLDVSLLRQTAGYANGLAVGALYFLGFTGIFLVLSVYFQDGLGLSPLRAGLLLTPFAVGSAFTAPLAGRLVSRIHRLITVLALSVMMTGVLLAALLVPGHAGPGLWVVAVPTLLLAGLGGGGVVSPNITLTLAEVPNRMAGAAGGALQTGQRIGSSIGAALLMTVYGVVSSAGPETALRAALFTSLGVLGLAMAMAVRSLVREGRPDPGRD
ncbi:MFS transporter [Nocardioides panaciterrulae]|uniref:EmrB/QacA subfamily drug resistance transporter n=1 Tax=Nocardioides panaciterrulae TaxID=661492 RepID=A0A7Y9E3Q2_9ACTN|nr:EmrB/QacA subfamily drug resistance transporter [Nocardioides panaciterrulae]